MRLGLFTTVHPGVRPFLAGWCRSVAAQSDGDVRVWIALDEVAPEEVLAAWDAPPPVRWVPGRPGDTPAEVRTRAIEAMVPALDAVVFVDADDLLLPDRVRDAREALEEADVVACALALGDEEGRPTGETFTLADGADAAALLPRANVFGLSNTAWRTAALAAALPIPAGARPLDWYLASAAWLGGFRLAFDPRIGMIYRRHGANMAPVRAPFTAEELTRSAAVVARHQRLIAPRAAAANGKGEGFAAARARLERFRTQVLADPDRLAAYVDALNALPDPVHPWWAPVAHPALAEVWE